MRKFSILERIEQLVRFITLVLYTFYLSFFVFYYPQILPLLSFVNRKCNNYFSKNFQLKEPIEYLGKSFAYGVMKILGIDVIVENNGCDMPRHNNESHIVMFTHGSNLDPMLLHAVYPFYLHFVAKISLFKKPFLGKLLKATRQIPIERGNLTEAIKSLEDAGRYIKKEQRSIGIAPEGTRRKKPSTGPEQEIKFKKGPFHLAKAACVDIVPAIIIGANRLYPAGSAYPMPGTVIVRFGPKISAKEIEESTIEALQEKVKKVFRDNLNEVDDKIIYSTRRKPYIQFLFTLLGHILIFTFFLRLFSSVF